MSDEHLRQLERAAAEGGPEDQRRHDLALCQHKGHDVSGGGGMISYSFDEVDGSLKRLSADCARCGEHVEIPVPLADQRRVFRGPFPAWATELLGSNQGQGQIATLTEELDALPAGTAEEIAKRIRSARADLAHPRDA